MAKKPVAQPPSAEIESVAQPPSVGIDPVVQPPSAGIEPVVQPPSAGMRIELHHSQPGAAVPQGKSLAQPPSLGIAKPAKAEYRRNLPHIQAEDRALFVTFCTEQRWILPESVRMRILDHCLHDQGQKLWMHGAVVMPDHVHLVFTPLRDIRGNTFGLTEIMSGMKGASAHTVNKLLHRTGAVWQNESFDHILRRDENIDAKVDYICQNPVRKGLVAKDCDYPWLWREGNGLSAEWRS